MGLEHDSSQGSVFFVRSLENPDQVDERLADPNNPYQIDDNWEVVSVTFRGGSVRTLKDDLYKYGRLTGRGMNSEPISSEDQGLRVGQMQESAKEAAQAYFDKQGEIPVFANVVEVTTVTEDDDIPAHEKPALVNQKALRLRENIDPEDVPLGSRGQIAGFMPGGIAETLAQQKMLDGRYGRAWDNYSVIVKGDKTHDEVIYSPYYDKRPAGNPFCFANTALNEDLSNFDYTRNNAKFYEADMVLRRKDNPNVTISIPVLPIVFFRNILHSRGGFVNLQYGDIGLVREEILQAEAQQARDDSQMDIDPTAAELQEDNSLSEEERSALIKTDRELIAGMAKTTGMPDSDIEQLNQYNEFRIRNEKRPESLTQLLTAYKQALSSESQGGEPPASALYTSFMKAAGDFSGGNFDSESTLRKCATVCLDALTDSDSRRAIADHEKKVVKEIQAQPDQEETFETYRNVLDQYIDLAVFHALPSLAEIHENTPARERWGYVQEQREHLNTLGEYVQAKLLAATSHYFAHLDNTSIKEKERLAALAPPEDLALIDDVFPDSKRHGPNTRDRLALLTLSVWLKTQRESSTNADAYPTLKQLADQGENGVSKARALTEQRNTANPGTRAINLRQVRDFFASTISENVAYVGKLAIPVFKEDADLREMALRKYSSNKDYSSALTAFCGFMYKTHKTEPSGSLVARIQQDPGGWLEKLSDDIEAFKKDRDTSKNVAKNIEKMFSKWESDLTQFADTLKKSWGPEETSAVDEALEAAKKHWMAELNVADIYMLGEEGGKKKSGTGVTKLGETSGYIFAKTRRNELVCAPAKDFVKGMGDTLNYFPSQQQDNNRNPKRRKLGKK